jgi:hypothetical protein
MLLEADDLPVHQAPTSLAHVMGGHPNAYDRFFFNGYREDLYFAVALGIYPNRGVIDAAVSTVVGSSQRSVFASGRLGERVPSLGPVTIELVEPMRVATIHVDAPEHGLRASITFTARSAAIEEPRQTRYDGERLFMDVTRATQLGSWSGWLEVDGARIALDDAVTYGTKDRSWGIRPVGDPAPMAPSQSAPQLFFVWAPLNFDDLGVHVSRFEDAEGVPWSTTAAVTDLLGELDRPVDARLVHHLRAASFEVGFASGRRRAAHAELNLTDATGVASRISLEPLLTFRMRGAGYLHPTYAHGRFHGDLVVAGEVHDTAALDTTSIHDVHVQHVVRARWGDKVGIGVLELLAIGPHLPSGLTGLLDGAP